VRWISELIQAERDRQDDRGTASQTT
jgi:hypothetical protein